MRIICQEEGLYALHLPGVTCHVLVDDEGAVLVDAGLAGCLTALKRLWRRLDLQPSDLRAILLTHGHLDHARGLRAVQEWAGAELHAHPAEQAHLDAAYPYRGWSRVAGALEAMGRLLLGYEPVAIERELADGDVLPFWGGLEVVHLPGHTDGHCGFWSPKRRVLSPGDLFASFLWSTHRAPRAFSSHPERVDESFDIARRLDPERVYPNHYRHTRNGADLRKRFVALC